MRSTEMGEVEAIGLFGSQAGLQSKTRLKPCEGNAGGEGVLGRHPGKERKSGV